MRFLEFFQEENGRMSIMRLLTFVFSIYSIWASAYILIHDPKEYAGCIAVFTSIAGTALAGKLIQKPMETKTP